MARNGTMGNEVSHRMGERAKVLGKLRNMRKDRAKVSTFED